MAGATTAGSSLEDKVDPVDESCAKAEVRTATDTAVAIARNFKYCMEESFLVQG